MMLTRYHVQKVLGDQLVLWINPQKVDYHVGTKWPNIKHIKIRVEQLGKSIPYGGRAALFLNNIFCRYDSFTVASDKYREVVNIEDVFKYQKIKDFVKNKDKIKDTVWYSELVNELEERGYAAYKKVVLNSREDIESFLNNYVMDIVESMEKSGYDVRKGRDIGVALIGKDGVIHKAGSGTHRFYVARIVGTELVPVKIAGVHKEWFDQHVGNNKSLSQLGKKLKEVEEEFS